MCVAEVHPICNQGCVSDMQREGAGRRRGISVILLVDEILRRDRSRLSYTNYGVRVILITNDSCTRRGFESSNRFTSAIVAYTIVHGPTTTGCRGGRLFLMRIRVRYVGCVTHVTIVCRKRRRSCAWPVVWRRNTIRRVNRIHFGCA